MQTVTPHFMVSAGEESKLKPDEELGHFDTYVQNTFGKDIFDECVRRVEGGAKFTIELLSDVLNEFNKEIHISSIRAGCTPFNSD